MRKVFLVLLIITVVLTGCQKNEFTPNENLPYQGDVENGMKQGEGTMSYDNGKRINLMEKVSCIMKMELFVMKENLKII